MTALHHLAAQQRQTDNTATPSGDSEAEAQHDGRNQSVSSGTNLRRNGTALIRVRLDSRGAALIALGNLAGLLCGDRVAKPTQVCMSTYRQ